MAYGRALVRLYPEYPTIVSLDGEVSNSTGAEQFKNAYPQRFFEMYVAEQNMVGPRWGFPPGAKFRSFPPSQRSSAGPLIRSE